jgi:site-specific recombinase XerD
LSDVSIAYFGKEHCEGYKTWMKKNNLSRKTINSSLSYMSRFFRVAASKEWLVDNHMKNVEKIKEREYRTDVVKRERFEPINGNEMDLIFKTLQEKKERSFIAFLAVIYYAWIRPVEILRLKIGDIDTTRGVIKLKKNDTKNNMGSHVQIVPPLKKILEEIDFKKYSSNDFLFSKNNLLPGPEPVSKTSVVRSGSKL